MSKRSLTTLLLAFLLQFSNSQNGYALYKKSMLENHESDDDYMNKAIQNLENQEYLLSFSETIALYKKDKELIINKDAVVGAYTEAISSFNGEVYYDEVNQSVTHQKDFSGVLFLITKNKIDWDITNDTLTIKNRLCYKATTSRRISNSKGQHEIKVIAWFAPDLSIPYGPDGYSGLPGLIIQLENNGTLTTLNKIEFFDKKKVDIKMPTVGEKVSEEQFTTLTSQVFIDRKSNRN